MTNASDSHLERAMRAVAKQPTQPNRFALYTALLTARLVVPLLPGTTLPEGHLPTAKDLATDAAIEGSDKPVFVVFGEDTDLVRWRDGGGPRFRISGTLLFPILAAAGCAGLRVNPNGRIGGMLYAHEVDTIAEAAVRRSAQS